MQDFLNAYQKEVDRFIHAYKQSENPSDPTALFWTNYGFEETVLDALQEQWADTILGLKQCKSEYRDIYYKVQKINSQAEKELREHFQERAQRSTIPPAPDMDHTTVHKVKYWKPPILKHQTQEYYDSLDYQTVYVVGQVIVQPSLWRGTKTYKFSEWSAGLLFPAEFKCSGDKEAKKAFEQRVFKYAAKLSQITDWSKFGEYPWAVRSALRDHLRELSGEVYEWS